MPRPKRNTSHLQTPEVAKKRVAAIRRSLRLRKKGLRDVGFIPLTTPGSDNREVVRRLLQLALELL